ncbi:hypothetical protein D9M69_687860 [compost metagenome]
MAIINGTINASIRSMTSWPSGARRASHWVSTAAASGMTISTTKASTKGAGSVAATRSGPTNTRRYTGSRSICASMSTGAAARSLSLDPPAKPLNTIT